MSAVVQEKLYSVQVGRGAGPSVKLEKLKISRLPLCNNTTTAIILCKDYLKNISVVSMQQHHQVQQQWSQIIFTRPKKNYSTQKSFLFNIRDLLHMIQGYRILLKLVILYLCLMREFHDIHLQNVFLIISNSSSPESLITLSKWLFKWGEFKLCHKSHQLVKLTKDSFGALSKYSIFTSVLSQSLKPLFLVCFVKLWIGILEE